MAISFSGAKNYKKHNGLPASVKVKKTIASPVHFYPLSQNGGIVLTPAVQTGDYILCGQKIADFDSFEAVPVISSVSGRVVSVTEDMITVENDMFYDECPYVPPTKSFDELTMREIMWIMRESGIYETGSGIPAHVLLSEAKLPEYAIVRCFDSDPYVSSQQAAAYGNAEKVLLGLHAAFRVLGIRKAIIAVQNDVMKTYYDFKYHLRYNNDISLYCLKARYPQSQDDILIKTLTGKSDTNAVILSAETLVNIADALTTGRPVTKKIVTVSGDDILSPDNFNVPLGATMISLLESAGYTAPQVVFEGGVVTGNKVEDLDTPVGVCTSSLVAFDDIKNIPAYRKELI